MKNAKDLFLEKLIIGDGAMGTWFAGNYHKPISDCEIANLTEPEIIKNIHLDYLDAGAQLLRSNTFAMINHETIENLSEISRLATSGFQIAVDAVKTSGKNAWVAADFGPVYGPTLQECIAAWEVATNSFIDAGADLFILETFADPQEVRELASIIREKKSDAVIIASFAISADGYTRKAIPLQQLDKIVQNMTEIDIFGLNCGIGPTHMRQLISNISEHGKPMSLMPNSGYPRMENQRMVFGTTPEYYAENASELYHPRLKIIGGCCGTTPEHIAALTTRIKQEKVIKPTQAANLPSADLKAAQENYSSQITTSTLEKKLTLKHFVTVCELDPPKNSDLNQLIAAAYELKSAGVDAVTIADSPLARVKLDPIIAAARLMRETGISVLPHLTCRDRNVNSLRSLILGAHSEGIRQLLLITGDRIPESDRGFVKPVFNVNSTQLIELAAQMNSDVFINEPFQLAAAADLGSANCQAELNRILKKQEAGASVLLTQPVYTWSDDSAWLAQKIRDSGLKLLIGLMPLVSYRNANYMQQEVPGITIPQEIISQFEPDMAKEQAEDIGIKQINNLIDSLHKFCDGFYLIAPFNRAYLISKLMNKINSISEVED